MTFGSGQYRYEVVEGWGQIPQLGLVSGVACDSRDRVYLFNRKPRPAVLVFERDGRFLTSWGEDLFHTPHGIWIDSRGDLYIEEGPGGGVVHRHHPCRKFCQLSP